MLGTFLANWALSGLPELPEQSYGLPESFPVG
jgi:hypothetical protein